VSFKNQLKQFINYNSLYFNIFNWVNKWAKKKKYFKAAKLPELF